MPLCEKHAVLKIAIDFQKQGGLYPITHAYLRISGPYQVITCLYQTINAPFGGYTKHKE
jgi:hypothetical protein